MICQGNKTYIFFITVLARHSNNSDAIGLGGFLESDVERGEIERGFSQQSDARNSRLSLCEDR